MAGGYRTSGGGRTRGGRGVVVSLETVTTPLTRAHGPHAVPGAVTTRRRGRVTGPGLRLELLRFLLCVHDLTVP